MLRCRKFYQKHNDLTKSQTTSYPHQQIIGLLGTGKRVHEGGRCTQKSNKK